MRTTLLWIGSVALAAGVAIAATRALDRHNGHSVQQNAEASETQQSDHQVSGTSSEDVEPLKAELAKKEAMIASLLLAKVQGGAPAPGSGANVPDPSAEAARILDGRLDENSLPSPAVAQMGARIRALEHEGILGETKLTDLKCAGVLCRITLNDEQADRLDRNTRRLAESASKAIGAMIVVDHGAGQKLIYAATTSQDLELPADSSTLAAQEAEQPAPIH